MSLPLDEAYSEKAEEKRQAEAKEKRKKRKKPKRGGRLLTAEKIVKADRTEKVYPEGCDPQDCKLSHTRVAWRLEDGGAILIARTNKTPKGAKRQTIVTSVLRTLAKQLSKFTLDSVIAEVQRWAKCGRSCFTDQAEAVGLSRPPPDAEQHSLLERIILESTKRESDWLIPNRNLQTCRQKLANK